MRILVLTPTFLPAIGGAELVILQVYRRLARKHSVLVLTPNLSQILISNTSSNEYDHLINFDVKHYKDKYTFMKIRGHKVTRGLIPPFSLSAAIAIKREIKNFKPDVLNVHYVMPTGLAGFYAQKFYKIPTVVTFTGRDVPGPDVPVLWKYWHRLIGLNCKEMTFVSRYCRDVIFGTNFNQGSIIYNGVENHVEASKDQREALRSKLQLVNGENVLFALQRIDYLKRIDVLIRCMSQIIKSKPNTRLIIGGKGPDLQRLKKISKKFGVSDKVHFAGFIPDNELPIYFSIADLFLFHSTYETFGIVLAEAMVHDKAIVSVNNTAIKEVVDNGATGILVPTLDHEAFTSAVIELLDDSDRRLNMEKKGKNKAIKYFQWDRIATEYEKILERSI
jgi:glycosyltransferase involved in cell wall biosynthesis